MINCRVPVVSIRKSSHSVLKQLLHLNMLSSEKNTECFQRRPCLLFDNFCVDEIRTYGFPFESNDTSFSRDLR